MTQINLDDFQKHIAKGTIPTEHAIQILVDNFGMKRAYEIMKPIYDEAFNENLPAVDTVSSFVCNFSKR
jgi:hypothetical protein